MSRQALNTVSYKKSTVTHLTSQSPEEAHSMWNVVINVNMPSKRRRSVGCDPSGDTPPSKLKPNPSPNPNPNFLYQEDLSVEKLQNFTPLTIKITLTTYIWALIANPVTLLLHVLNLRVTFQCHEGCALITT